MKVICNNLSCKLALSKKSFNVDDLSSSCPSCGKSNLLPDKVSKYVSGKEHHSTKKLNQSKEFLKKTHSTKFSSDDSINLKKIEFSYSKKMAEMEKAIKNSEIMKKFKSIDNDISEGSLELASIKYELEKMDNLFDSYHSNGKISKSKNVKSPKPSKSITKK